MKYRMGKNMIHVAICDDEDVFLFMEQKLVSEYMKNHDYKYRVDTFSSGIDFLQSTENIGDFDIVFLDINMDELDGIETAKKLREYGSQAYVVFVTAFITYAPEGYKVDATRFLLKDSETLKPSIEECLDSIILKMNYREYRETFVFLEGKRVLNPDEIVYIESNLHKLIFCLTGKKSKKYSMYEKLDVMEKRLYNYGFCRIHKSFLVNMKYVQEIGRYDVRLTENICHKTYLSVSQSRYNNAKEQFIFYRGEI